MDATASVLSVDRSEARSDGSGQKRALQEEEEERESAVPPPKKKRGSVDLGRNVRKVAEIVLVLATMGNVRAGKKPTSAEVEMMVEARKKLAEVCGEFAPKDVFPRDAFGAVIEDLGLNRLREQRLKIQSPKMSIAEKLLLTKRKMEKSEEFSLHSATYSSQQLQGNLPVAAESRGSSRAVRVLRSDKPGPAPISAGAFKSPPPLVHASPKNSTTLPYQLPTSEVRPMGASLLPNSQLGRDSSSLQLPRVDRPHFRLDGRSNGSLNILQAQANSSSDHKMVATPTWAMQHQSASAAKIAVDKVPAQGAVRTESDVNASLASQTISKPVITQAITGNPTNLNNYWRGASVVQPPKAYETHYEIGKIVQKVLQPRIPEHPTWTPPSRDYMNKVLACPMCKLTISEVDTALVCDACERGYHLKCIHCNPKAVPRGEWHCAKCLTLSNGKPLPPKYGRVMRNISTQKLPSQVAAASSALENKVQPSDEKVKLQTIAANGNSVLHSSHDGTVGNNIVKPIATMDIADSREMQGSEKLSHQENGNDKSLSVSWSNDLIRILETATTPSPEEKTLPPENSDAFSSSTNHSKLLESQKDCNQLRPSEDADILAKQYPDDSNINKDSGEHCSEGRLESSINVEGVKQSTVSEIIENSTSFRESGSSPSNSIQGVKWVGDALKVVDDIAYYQSCSINGILYKLQDYAICRSDGNKFMPSKLRAMWEDNKTGSKWVTVGRCYFPGDLPEGVGRPCSPESNEVYESNHDVTLMAGLIHGPCDVLPPRKFVEENGRHAHLETPSGEHKPLFLCKWFYDEVRRLFRDVSCQQL